MSGARALLCWAVALTLALAPLAAALELSLPGNATKTREVVDDDGSYALPIGPWAQGALPMHDISGRITTQAWRIDGSALTTLQLMDDLVAQLKAAGYATLFRCHAQECGGFDFRFATDVLPPPEMFVDLFDYRFLSARLQGKATGQSTGGYVTLMISRSGASAYVQITEAAPTGDKAPIWAADNSATPAADPAQDAPILQTLTAQGHAVLRDLDFATGADTLGPGPFASLAALAGFLKADGTRRIALVGHTDTVGGLDANLALSRRRAGAVLDRLADTYGVPRAQMEANGIAYLAPVAPNSTATGREANRRVEVVLLNTD